MAQDIVDVAVIGAGPYGLSVAAHLRHHGVAFRVFGRPMDSWLAHMPKGMLLKSDGFASNIYDPENEFSLARFCAERGIEYADTGVPVRLETFAAYGLAFKAQMVPALEDKLVSSVERLSDRFLLHLEDGETLTAKRVILAVGITHFEHIPGNLAHLPQDLLSHSGWHHDLERFRGRRVVVIGGGASALDLAGLLCDVDARPELVSRGAQLRFHSMPTGRPRSLWQQIRHPQSGLGPGLRSSFFAEAPLAFHYLPERLRLETVRRTLGPSGGWFSRDKVIGRVPLRLGQSPLRADIQDRMVRLCLGAADGSSTEIKADHIIAATGYRVDIERLKFLSAPIRSALKAVHNTPVLSSSFESSIPGLYFVGVAAANSFGPVMRFAYGAGFAAQHLANAVAKSLSRNGVVVPKADFVPTSE
jgi:thioredoxin reductase